MSSGLQKTTGKEKERTKMSQIGEKIGLALVVVVVIVALVTKSSGLNSTVIIALGLILIVGVIAAFISRLVLHAFSIRGARQTYRRGK